MSTQIEFQRSSILPTVLVGSAPLLVIDLIPGLALRLILAEFELGVDACIREVHPKLNATGGDISLRVEIAENVDANIVLSGKCREDRGFDISHLSIQFWPAEQHADVAFVASTLSAAIKLSREVQLQVPHVGLALTLTAFDSPLLEAGRLLRERQTAYRLMVIERATGIDFGPLPSTISGEDVGTIGFIYHAIVDRTFIDGLENVEVPTAANEEGSRQLNQLKTSVPLTFPNENLTISKSLLGRSVKLGPRTVTVYDPYIENLDRIQQEMVRCDGHPVKIVIRSRTNRARYSLPEAPSLPAKHWEPAIQKLIELEGELDSRLIERYHALAASTLAGLSEEERTRVTRRVELDDETFD